MKTVAIEPMEDRIVIEVDEAEDRTPGGIVLPEQAKDKPQRGSVIAVGPGRYVDGYFVEPKLKAGDRVLFTRYAGSEIEVDGERVMILREGDVLAKIG